MPVTVICPNLTCGQTVVAPESLRGKVVRCAHCGKHFMVPIRPNDQTPRKDDSRENKRSHGGKRS